MSPEGSQKWPNPCKYHAKRARGRTTKKTPKSTPSAARGVSKATQNGLSKNDLDLQECPGGSKRGPLLCGLVSRAHFVWYLHGFLTSGKK